MKKAILLVSFGTKHKEALEKSIGGIVAYLQENFQEYTIYNAFTSQVVRKKIWEEYQIVIPSVEDAMEQMSRDGVTEVVVQPAYVVYGAEYKKLEKALTDYEKFFKTIKLGKPLLGEAKDYHACVKCLAEKWKIGENEVVVLVGHGTKEEAQNAYRMLESVFHEEGYTNVYIGTVNQELSFMELTQKLKTIKKEERGTLRIIPFMIVCGEHIIQSILSEENGWLAQFKKMGFSASVVQCGLGEMKGIQHLFAEHMKEMIEG